MNKGAHENYDVVIVGASVAGACAAIALAPLGYRILLLDRAVFPRNKPCGEGIMPQGVDSLDQLGLLPQILTQGAVKFQGIRYRNLHGEWAQADFPPAAGATPFGLVMRRLELDHLLLTQARGFPNITVREGFRVTDVIQDGTVVQGVSGHPVDRPDKKESFRAPLTIGADGTHSIFHGQCGLTRTYLQRKRFGVTGHLEGVSGLGPYVEVLLHPQGEIYVAPSAPATACVALLLEKKAMAFFKGDLAQCYLRFLQSFEGFRERVVESKLLPTVFAVGPLGFTVEPCYRSGMILLGDSGGFLDPLTGLGITLALKNVQAALPIIQRAFAARDFSAQMLGAYAVNRFRLVEDFLLFTRLLLNLSRPRFFANRAIRKLSHDPCLFQKLMGIAAGTNHYRDFSVREKLSLLIG
ncbi:FAD-dependent monooxygenase [Acidobacteria bacterium AH-259-A15]|nr:FAD-dependent monooxygenase [Acidobacteria bacterium AH-259-A15]